MKSPVIIQRQLRYSSFDTVAIRKIDTWKNNNNINMQIVVLVYWTNSYMKMSRPKNRLMRDFCQHKTQGYVPHMKSKHCLICIIMRE